MHNSLHNYYCRTGTHNLSSGVNLAETDKLNKSDVANLIHHSEFTVEFQP